MRRSVTSVKYFYYVCHCCRSGRRGFNVVILQFYRMANVAIGDGYGGNCNALATGESYLKHWCACILRIPVLRALVSHH